MRLYAHFLATFQVFSYQYIGGQPLRYLQRIGVDEINEKIPEE